jgi:hypothetical protein
MEDRGRPEVAFSPSPPPPPVMSPSPIPPPLPPQVNFLKKKTFFLLMFLKQVYKKIVTR